MPNPAPSGPSQPYCDSLTAPDGLPIADILFRRPAADARRVAYHWRPTVMTIPEGAIRDGTQAAILLYETEQLSARLREPGQNRAGPLTAGFRDVLRAMLDLTHFETGRASFSYETIARRANRPRSLVAAAIRVIERLTGVVVYRRVMRAHREVRPGHLSPRSSNVYVWQLRARVRRLREALVSTCAQRKSSSRTETYKHTNGLSSSGAAPLDPRQQREMAKAMGADRKEANALQAAFARFSAAVAARPATGSGEAVGNSRGPAPPPVTQQAPPRSQQGGSRVDIVVNLMIDLLERDTGSGRSQQEKVTFLLKIAERAPNLYPAAAVRRFRAYAGLDHTY
ncbi:hypothetical protein [Belnapia moabensis]|uniref:hypothetical protein n=1 Tax=Belnapia moabensis TaxID=365533 RepID=UPI0012EE9337|nr:hypothetical protein [Belnapia moabensis]